MPVPESLILPDAASPLEAAGRVQDRPVESRYHDVVVSFHDGSYGTLVVADLFAEVAYTHEYLAVHDSLTGLGNRALFLNHLRGAHARSANPDASRYGVLFVDLDGFKPINDVLGHDAGDTALRVVAQRLRSFESENVTVARFGGDEFGLLVEHVESQETLTSLAAQINRKLENPVAIGDESIKLAASVGVALADRDSAPEENLRNADMAMYAAKRERSGTYAVYESAMHTRATRHLYMRSELQAALDHNEFEVFFQPACTLADAHVTSVEALVRWRHPDRGLTLPGQFIPMCERTGLIVPLGSWGIARGLRDQRPVASRPQRLRRPDGGRQHLPGAGHHARVRQRGQHGSRDHRGRPVLAGARGHRERADRGLRLRARGARRDPRAGSPPGDG